MMGSGLGALGKYFSYILVGNRLSSRDAGGSYIMVNDIFYSVFYVCMYDDFYLTCFPKGLREVDQ